MSKSTYDEIIELFKYGDPYSEIPKKYLDSLGPDFQGWIGLPKLLEEYVENIKPKIIFEIGSWKGLSTSSFGGKIKDMNLDSCVIAIDTWLGSSEHRESLLLLEHINAGFPEGLYYQFLINMKYMKLEKVVLPFRQSSHIASRFFKEKELKCDILFIDGSHEYEDVLQDLNDYYPLVNNGGLIVGDDLEHKEVRRAAEKFSIENNLNLIDHLEFFLFKV